MEGLASNDTAQKTIMIDALQLKTHCTVSGLRAQRGADDQRGRLIEYIKSGLDTKLHAVTGAKGRPLRVFMTACQISDYAEAAAPSGRLQSSDWLLADRGP
jgi:hypothetical protein